MNSKYLLDTHIFIWWMEKNKRLQKNIYDIINNPRNSIFLSVASIWEIVLKRAKGKLKTTTNIERGLKKFGFVILPIEISHVLETEKLPNYHSDPFDRLIIAQSRIEKLMVISHDQKIWKYNIDLLKC